MEGGREEGGGGFIRREFFIDRGRDGGRDIGKDVGRREGGRHLERVKER